MLMAKEAAAIAAVSTRWLCERPHELPFAKPPRGTATPSTPAPPAPINVQTLDGGTGQPVSAAVSPSRPMPGATVTAVAGGYLPRVQLAAPQLYLWPGDEAYLRALVYGEFSPGGLLARWTRPFTVKPLADREDLTAATVSAAGAACGLGLTPSGPAAGVLGAGH